MIPSSLRPEAALERSSRLVEELLAGWNAHDSPQVAALHAEEFEGVDVGRPAPYRGLEGAALLMRIPPTGRKVSVRGVSMLTVSEAGITHGLYVWDTAGLLRDIGPPPAL